MERELVFEELQEEDIEKVNELYNSVYKSGRTLEKFKWEFVNGPCGKAIYIVAKDKTTGKIVGTQCAIPIYLVTHNGKKILSAKSEDTLVDPAYRGMKIFDKMYDLLFEKCRKAGIQYIWGFTYAIKPFTKIGFETPFKANQGLLVLNTVTSYNYLKKLNKQNSLIDKVKILGLSILSVLKPMLSLGGVKDLQDYRFNDSRVGGLNQLFRFTDEFAGYSFLYQDEHFLNWRVYNNPYPNQFYQYNLFDAAGNLVANLFYNINKEGFAYIIQVAFAEQLSLNVQTSFIKRCIAEIKKKKVFMIRYWGFDTNGINRLNCNVLERAGFTIINKGITFVWKPLLQNDLNPNLMVLSRMASQGTI